MISVLVVLWTGITFNEPRPVRREYRVESLLMCIAMMRRLQHEDNAIQLWCEVP